MYKRLIRICASLIMVIILASNSIVYANVAAPIDIQYHWAANDIYSLIKRDIMNGYYNNRFKPSKNITMAELCKLLYNVNSKCSLVNNELIYNETEETTEKLIEISDVTQELLEWQKEPISWAIQSEIVDEYTNEYYRYNEYVNRGTMAWAIYNYLVHIGYEFENNQEMNLTDINDCGSVKKPISALYEDGIISGYIDNTYRPEEFIKRGEVAVIIRKLLNIEAEACPKTIPSYNVIDVPYYSQVYPVRAMIGCEGTSLLMGLKGKGYAKNIELYDFLNNLPRHSSNPAKGLLVHRLNRTIRN